MSSPSRPTCGIRLWPGLLFAIAAVLSAGTARADFTVFEAAGANAAAIQPTVDAYRAALGALNPNVAGSFGSGRREINWDGVPNNFADPNALPANFFNANSPRGVVFSTPGTGFLVSASTGNPTSTPTLFGFPSEFTVFSAQRLFAPVGSTITEINFFVPGSTTAATTNGFGAVFTDVETADLTRIEYFDTNNTSIFSRSVLTSGNAGLSFLGARANMGERIARVRITTGNAALLSNGQFGPGSDPVVMDDFLYGEPIAVPEPSSLLLVGTGLSALLILGRRARRRTA